MNHAGELAFGIRVDKAITMKCHELFDNGLPCSDCTAGNVVIGEPVSMVRTKVIPMNGITVKCKTVPFIRNGKIRMVIQCLRPVDKEEN